MNHWRKFKCEELKVHQRIFIQAIEGNLRALELSKMRGARRTVSSINKYIATIVKGVFLCIRQLVFHYLGMVLQNKCGPNHVKISYVIDLLSTLQHFILATHVTCDLCYNSISADPLIPKTSSSTNSHTISTSTSRASSP